jgi:thiamine biosynthesis protein ThiS
MTVLVNGKQHEFEDGETLALFLERLGLGGRYALVERNGEAVERARYEQIELAEGDELVVARPVAGG